jgi:lipopolysaccharide transport system ATP-binding protein
MSQPIIKAEGLGKKYVIDHQQEGKARYRSLRDTLMNGMRVVGRRLRRSPQGTEWKKQEEFWALRDVAFEVQPGEVVGIIGRNGAGKSTLLKILSRITEPTTGEVVLRGRVASLLEVGTGFHPELTGRENVFLNGTILGMSRAEIRKKFDEIVAFAEVEKFLDTPVKRYSSGMYMRLAFAVAAHLEPEILIVDEVLAVGDSAFQKKCLGKMGDVARQGRTVLFVSHNMAAVQHLCQKAMLLSAGQLVEEGPANGVVSGYLRRAETASRGELTSFKNRTGTRAVVFTSFHVEDEAGLPIHTAQSGQNVTLVFGFSCPGEPIEGRQVNVGFGLHLSTGERLTILYASHTGEEFTLLPATGAFRCQITRLPFNPGRYYVFPRIEVNGVEADFPRDGIGYVDVESGDFYNTGRQTIDQSYSSFLISGRWRLGLVTGQDETRPEG